MAKSEEKYFARFDIKVGTETFKAGQELAGLRESQLNWLVSRGITLTEDEAEELDFDDEDGEDEKYPDRPVNPKTGKPYGKDTRTFQRWLAKQQSESKGDIESEDEEPEEPEDEDGEESNESDSKETGSEDILG